MKKSLILFIIFALMFTISSYVFADRGSIPFQPAIRIFEPNQQALIAWNGKEEILILSTKLYADQDTKILEVLPLPHEPEIKKSSRNVLRKANELLTLDHSKQLVQPITRSSDSRQLQGGEVKQEVVIGSHDITVVKVLNENTFTNWVNNYLKQKGKDNPVIPEELKKTIKKYIDKDYNFFVFDTVDVGPKPYFNEAIYYKFKSDKLYYPLEITKSDHGESNVSLLVLTESNLINFHGIQRDKIEFEKGPKLINRSDAEFISSDIADLFASHFAKNDGSEKIKLASWKIVDDLTNFDSDLLADYTIPKGGKELIFMGHKYINCVTHPNYPFETEKTLSSLHGKAEMYLGGTRSLPWYAYSLNGKILFNAITGEPLGSLENIEEKTLTFEGYSGQGYIWSENFLTQKMEAVDIPNAFFVTDIIGYKFYSGLRVEEDGQISGNRNSFWKKR
ncbi:MULTISPECIES: DUF2330 domain-containing protein [unclassified Halanaerobium]|uniref:DUF2330 domain-containing protein n=1 Tax=unclassified Halanaerobium TaxID=2641197 RepID=UPI000DF14EA5|nr:MULTISPECIES: DUF2330 domain-containing protein [unclassified Halanaerobium]RCW50738.1 uncharacterized protein DUF2330 [Halanaerobium sp. MA284_MarDTE_T2]RCW80178.1 uncharacterized protein DUF2330 [Halanaerobium sp. DL-01]